MVTRKVVLLKLLIVISLIAMHLCSCKDQEDVASAPIFVKKLIWKELEDKDKDGDDPFSDGKKHVLVESGKEHRLPKSMFANDLILGESAPDPPFKIEFDYYALMKDGEICAVLGLEQSTKSGKSNIAIVSFSIEEDFIELGKASFVKNEIWSSYLRNLEIR